jgi:hypothetical protein
MAQSFVKELPVRPVGKHPVSLSPKDLVMTLGRRKKKVLVEISASNGLSYSRIDIRNAVACGLARLALLPKKKTTANTMMAVS